MQGIELSRKYFEECGLPFLRKECPEVLPHLASGLVGHGSECFGFDDEISRDHDFTACFSLWLPDEREGEFGFRLERAYARLLKEFPPPLTSPESLFAGSERGVCTIGEFYLRHIGLPHAPENWRQWLYTPEYAFAEATNGAVFYDAPEEFTSIRETLLAGMPEDVRKKKIAARAVRMAQSGQYNFSRCLKHGERGAAFLSLSDFVQTAASMIFLLNRHFMPYGKWMFRAMRNLSLLSELNPPLEFLLTENASDELRQEMIEDICGRVIQELKEQDLSDAGSNYLEPHAVEVMKRIRNREIRALHVMEG